MSTSRTVIASPMLPQPGWINHVGTPNAPTDRFPVAPPDEIGPVVSATTLLSADGPKLGRRIPGKIVLVVGVLLLSAMPGAFAWVLAKSLPVGIAVTGGVWLLTSWLLLGLLIQRAPACSYLGRDGFARCTGVGRRVRVNTLRFSDIADADVRKVMVTLAGAHVATRYEFDFSDARNKSLLQFVALHGKKGPSTETDESFFGLAAVDAWQRQRAAARRAA